MPEDSPHPTCRTCHLLPDGARMLLSRQQAVRLRYPLMGVSPGRSEGTVYQEMWDQIEEIRGILENTRDSL